MLGWPGGSGCIGLTLLVMVRRWLRLEVEKALSGHRLVWLGGRGCIGPNIACDSAMVAAGGDEEGVEWSWASLVVLQVMTSVEVFVVN